jgi:hypothetical protein
MLVSISTDQQTEDDGAVHRAVSGDRRTFDALDVTRISCADGRCARKPGDPQERKTSGRAERHAGGK